jgi:hypothetical protein
MGLEGCGRGQLKALLQQLIAELSKKENECH